MNAQNTPTTHQESSKRTFPGDTYMNTLKEPKETAVNFSRDFMSKTADELRKAIDDLLRIHGLPEIIDSIDDLLMLNLLMVYNPADYSPDGPDGYNRDVSDTMGAVSWDISKMRELTGKQIIYGS